MNKSTWQSLIPLLALILLALSALYPAKMPDGLMVLIVFIGLPIAVTLANQRKKEQ